MQIKSPYLALFGNFGHQSMHRVLQGTLIRPSITMCHKKKSFRVPIHEANQCEEQGPKSSVGGRHMDSLSDIKPQKIAQYMFANFLFPTLSDKVLSTMKHCVEGFLAVVNFFIQCLDIHKIHLECKNKNDGPQLRIFSRICRL